MADINNDVYLSYINEIETKSISKTNNKLSFYTDQSNYNIKNNLYNSYDYIMHEKYNVKLNEKTLERFKNHFR